MTSGTTGMRGWEKPATAVETIEKISLDDLHKREKVARFYQSASMPLLAAVVSMIIYARSYAFKKSPRLMFVCVQIVLSVELFSLG